jgi:hypothetical protein
MQMYVNHFDRQVKRDDGHSTVGIVACLALIAFREMSQLKDEIELHELDDPR